MVRTKDIGIDIVSVTRLQNNATATKMEGNAMICDRDSSGPVVILEKDSAVSAVETLLAASMKLAETIWARTACLGRPHKAPSRDTRIPWKVAIRNDHLPIHRRDHCSNDL